MGECCQATCIAWDSCDSGWALKTTKIGCGAKVASCNNAKCCETTCDSVGHTCKTAHWLRHGSQNGRACKSDAECTDAECCQATCKAWDSCDSGWALKTTDPGCGAKVASCNNAKCCETTCDSVGHTCKTAHWLRLGSQNGRACKKKKKKKKKKNKKKKKKKKKNKSD